MAAAGADGGQHILQRGRAQQPHGPRSGLLHGLQEHVARPLGQPVGVLEDDDLPAAHGRGELRPADQLAGLLHADGQQIGTDDLHIGVRTDHGGVAAVAEPAARLAPEGAVGAGALQGGREGPGGGGPPGAGRPGEQPGVGHPGRGGRRRPGLDGGDQGVGVTGGGGQLRLHPLLSHQVVPYGHPAHRLSPAVFPWPSVPLVLLAPAPSVACATDNPRQRRRGPPSSSSSSRRRPSSSSARVGRSSSGVSSAQADRGRLGRAG